jgi:hypothetical protein
MESIRTYPEMVMTSSVYGSFDLKLFASQDVGLEEITDRIGKDRFRRYPLGHRDFLYDLPVPNSFFR